MRLVPLHPPLLKPRLVLQPRAEKALPATSATADATTVALAVRQHLPGKAHKEITQQENATWLLLLRIVLMLCVYVQPQIPPAWASRSCLTEELPNTDQRAGCTTNTTHPQRRYRACLRKTFLPSRQKLWDVRLPSPRAVCTQPQ